MHRLLEEDGVSLMPAMVRILFDMAPQLAEINARIADLDAEIRTHARHNADMQRLIEISGIGPTIATALVAAISNCRSFNRGAGLGSLAGGGAVLREIQNRAPQALVLFLKFIQPLQLTAAHSAILLAPPIKRLLCYGDLA